MSPLTEDTLDHQNGGEPAGVRMRDVMGSYFRSSDTSRCRVAGTDAAASGFRPTDPGLVGYVILAFADFDHWFEEEDEIISHPHDPYGRIDIRGTCS